jgi:glycine betaine catabolism B
MLRLKSVNFDAQQFQNHDLTPNHSGNEWVIGRSPTCDVVLTNPEVSRVHGRITYMNNAYHYLDIGSTAGSMLNGEVVKVEAPYALNIGDLLQLGETFIYVEEVADPKPQLDVPTLSIPLSHGTSGQWSTQDLWCRCDRIIDESHDVKTFCFMAETPILFDFLPGQFVTLGIEIDGKPVLRPYSISSSPTRPHHLSVTIKRVPSSGENIPAGLVSNWMHDYFRVGDRLKLVGGAMGVFTCLPELPSKMLLISAGSGITPMMSMSRWVQDTLAPSDIVFLHSARQVEDIVFRSELATMAAQMPNFRLAVTLTQAQSSPWMGLTGRISPAMLNLLVPDLMDRSVFVCGPNAFMQHVRETLESMGFPMHQYEEESFGGAPVKPKAQATNHAVQPSAVKASAVVSQAATVEAPTVTATLVKPETATAVSFTDSGQTCEADGSLSILEVAEQAGVSIRSACRMGVCGACKVQTHKGHVRYEGTPAALSDTDQADGQILACVAYPVDHVEVEA